MMMVTVTGQVAADFEMTAPSLKTFCIYGGAPYRPQVWNSCCCCCYYRSCYCLVLSCLVHVLSCLVSSCLVLFIFSCFFFSGVGCIFRGVLFLDSCFFWCLLLVWRCVLVSCFLFLMSYFFFLHCLKFLVSFPKVFMFPCLLSSRLILLFPCIVRTVLSCPVPRWPSGGCPALGPGRGGGHARSAAGPRREEYPAAVGHGVLNP